jgi:acyl-CoA thioester hydrolase
MPDSRAYYKHFQPIASRWNDNDVYGHVNNIEYYGTSTRSSTRI